ncbi:TetR family transcriptional regulator C-terminal domain-containing protein [Tenacibaculum tangerinum]|uniref:TetR family transcriptional regulator C-terminal domain-containing protein n=1 Tax=Tenacibaculum tangerinum TaxID=3038772 RepID=A0ABY8L2F3_9FLAO|nr:TetR family transcriptional regulator C-terminal domain-containing protein [Tenacibaculum tangerinum]WGH74280.1 TetR family transcriptional regulator C-terminal domain-containing protein [Tenacibaculum tangerinum]
MNTVLTTGEPTSIFAFAKENNFEEADFYKHYSSFESLEKAIFKVFAKETIALLHKTDAYADYSAKDKLLSFYFTFFELLTANRSYVMLQFKGMKSDFSKLSVLKGLRAEFIDYINALNLEKIDFKHEKVNKIQDQTVAEGYWMQLLIILKFWVDDESPNFEKTDVFIEKSVKASFDIQQIAPVKSVIDLAKFLWKEKSPMMAK